MKLTAYRFKVIFHMNLILLIRTYEQKELERKLYQKN